MTKVIVTMALALGCWPAFAAGDSGDATDSRGSGHHLHYSGPLDHAPIGVVGDHTHDVGDWMVSYRFGTMWMDGNRTGTSSTSLDDVLAAYMVAPENMTTLTNMLGMMHAPVSRVTFAAMLTYVFKRMEHRTSSGEQFTTRADGFGDLKVSALVRLMDRNGHKLHLNAGVSIPIGSVDETDETPAGPDQKLPYPMQLGSGTWDLLPGLAYNGFFGSWSWGLQGSAVVHLGGNNQGYTLGDAGQATAWTARQLSHAMSVSARFLGSAWRNIEGADSDLNPMMVPTAEPNLRRGYRFDVAFGTNYAPTGYFKGHRLAAEFVLPFYQDLEGPQLEMDWGVIVGWQYAWNIRNLGR